VGRRVGLHLVWRGPGRFDRRSRTPHHRVEPLPSPGPFRCSTSPTGRFRGTSWRCSSPSPPIISVSDRPPAGLVEEQQAVGWLARARASAPPAQAVGPGLIRHGLARPRPRRPGRGPSGPRSRRPVLVRVTHRQADSADQKPGPGWPALRPDCFPDGQAAGGKQAQPCSVCDAQRGRRCGAEAGPVGAAETQPPARAGRNRHSTFSSGGLPAPLGTDDAGTGGQER